MKVAFFELQDWEKDFFEKNAQGVYDPVFSDKPANKDNAGSVSDSDGLVTFIYSHINKDVLDKLQNLKWIATMSTGFDHIDIEECKRRGIKVLNVPTYGENTVAEHAFALIFAISRRLIESWERVKSGQFSPEGLTGFDLYGKTLGVIGVGNIGCHSIRIAKGIGMNVLGYKRTPDPKMEQELGFKFVDMDTLLSTSDIITLHIPYSAETHHFLGDEQFAKMKDGVVIINTSRGAIIDTSALVNAINSGKVAAAGLDVLEEEPLLAEEKALLSAEYDKETLMKTLENHMLLNNPKVIITPHNGFNSKEALQRIMSTTLENIKSCSNGQMQNLVTG